MSRLVFKLLFWVVFFLSYQLEMKSVIHLPAAEIYALRQLMEAAVRTLLLDYQTIQN